MVRREMQATLAYDGAMGALELSLAVFVVGILLFWGGYYVALVTAWRAGVRGVGTVIALMAGLCCCGGVAVLAVHWDKIQKQTFEAIANGGDAVALGARLSRFKIAAGVAVIGMVLQLFAGYMVPDDDEYDDYDDYSYSDESYPDETYPDDSYPDEPSTEEPTSDPVIEDEPVADVEPAEEPAVVPVEDAEEDAAPRPDAVSGIVVGLSQDRRAAFVLDPSGGRWVRLARGRISGIEPGMTVHALGETRDDVLVVPSLTDGGVAPWLDMPRPVRLESELGSPPSDRSGRWVILPNVRANSPTELMASDGSSVRVRAPRGLLTRDTAYTAIRGALVDTRPIDRRGRVELWIVREEDVIAAQ